MPPFVFQPIGEVVRSVPTVCYRLIRNIKRS